MRLQEIISQPTLVVRLLAGCVDERMRFERCVSNYYFRQSRVAKIVPEKRKIKLKIEAKLRVCSENIIFATAK
jgi:hypothetical protein